MHNIQELREKLMNELCEYASKKIDSASLSAIDTLAHSIKNIDKIMESGYSGARYRRDGMGRFVGDYRDGYSMNQDGYNGGDDNQNSYSMDYSRDMKNIKQDLRDIMNSADEHTKQKLQRIVSQM